MVGMELKILSPSAPPHHPLLGKKKKNGREKNYKKKNKECLGHEGKEGGINIHLVL